LPPERVDETIEYEIEEAEQKRLGLTPTGDFDSIQGSVLLGSFDTRHPLLELVRNPPTAKEAANLAARFAVIDYVEGDTEKTAKYDLSEDYVRFMFAAEVEPTNNHSEQQIRHCVIDRRRPTAWAPVKELVEKLVNDITNECGR